MNFRQLILLLADKVGHQHLPLRADANDLEEFLKSDAVHHDLVTKVVKAIYKANRCGYLDAPISKDITFSTLGKLQREIAQSRTTDIDQFNLINEFGNALSKNLIEAPIAATDDDPPCDAGEEQLSDAEVYRFKPSRLGLLSSRSFIRK